MPRSWAPWVVALAPCVIAACAPAPPQRPPAPEAQPPRRDPVTTSQAPPAASSAARARTSPPCEQLEREARATLRPYFDEHRRAFGEFDGRAFARDLCWPDPRGAWALSPVEVKVEPSRVVRLPFPHDSQPAVSGTMRLVRASADGARAATDAMPIAFPDTWRFDWSGDGVDEIAVPRAGDAFPSLDVWTATARGVERYAPAQIVAARAVEDVDGDGRPDLLFTAPYDGKVASADGMDVAQAWSHEQGGFWLVAHSRADGTFSTDDEVARAFARRGCALADQRGSDAISGELGVGLRVRCARLRGETRREAEAIIARACKRREDCLDLPMLRAWAAATPPLSIR